MPKGKLKPEDERCIRQNFIYLKGNIEPKDLIDFLYQHEAIELEDKNRISKIETKIDRSESLLQAILEAGPGCAFNVFLQSLQSKYSHILEHLRRKAEEYNVIEKQKKEILQLKERLDKAATQLETKDEEIRKLKSDLVTWRRVEPALKHLLISEKDQLLGKRLAITEKKDPPSN